MVRILKAIFGTKQERDIKALIPMVERISSLETEVSQYKDEDFISKTEYFKKQIAEKKIKIKEIIPLAFAMVREASIRKLSMRHFDVQLMGGLILEDGKIAEMKTGEGKTLTATLAVYTRALEGKGVHIVTVNDYLSKRDSHDLKPLYEYLGLTVGCIDEYEPHSEGRRKAYDSDVTFGTNNEFGFDFLRDNMISHMDQRVVRRGYNFCIIDEVDSVLIDEARTPLIISGPSESNVERYYSIDKIIPRLKEAEVDEMGKEKIGTGDFVFDKKDNNIYITEEGGKKIEGLLSIDSLFSINNIEVLHHVNQSLRAHKTLQRDVDYIVENGEVVIIDEFTGRKMEGRRFSDGLHQAIEAKERVQIQNENQTLASVTFQNFFRMYSVISGMTGTADTEAHEFKKIYNLDVLVVPTNKEMIRNDFNDKVFRTKKEKYQAITKKVFEAYEKGQPVLVGTLSVESSEELSKIFKKNKLSHEILNAKNHSREAEIIKKAGEYKSITIATSMAGRGTDIKLGNKITDVGGLLVVGSERAESRRVDNQLRGRSGRQGDPGESQFYLSLEDELMLRFGSDRISNIMLKIGMDEGEEIQHSLITRSIESAQKKVENRNFDVRKHLLEYDDVMNEQRKIIYAERNRLLDMNDLDSKIDEICENTFSQEMYTFANYREEVNESLYMSMNVWLQQNFSMDNWVSKDEFLHKNYNDLESLYIDKIKAIVKDKFVGYDEETQKEIKKSVMLSIVDSKWKDHLNQMDQLREGIFLRSYAEKKPITEFKNEGYKLFEEMIDSINLEVLNAFIRLEFGRINDDSLKSVFNQNNMIFENHEKFNSFGKEIQGDKRKQEVKGNTIKSTKTIGRNEPCPCGSGKKYKNCHGSLK